jgi:hypothetical protein
MPATARPAPDRIDLQRVREIAESFKALVKGSFSSDDVNDILYDKDGLPK